MLIFFLFFTIYMSLTTHFFVSDFWRCLVVHMWVEVTFDILTTVIVAYLYREMGLVSRAKAERAGDGHLPRLFLVSAIDLTLKMHFSVPDFFFWRWLEVHM